MKPRYAPTNLDPNIGPERDTQRDIDRILAALGDAQPPAHLEHRILETLQRRTQPASRFPHWTSSLFSPARLGVWTLGLATATILLAVAALSLHKPGGPASTAGGPPFRASAKGWGIAPRATALPGSASNIASATAPPPVSNSVILSGADRLSVRAVEEPRSSRPHAGLPALSNDGRQLHILLCDCDPTALAEANAPSRPAPPLPLTAQEKLLLRVARHPDPVEVAALDPREREASIARDQAEYRQFFHPPEPQAEPATAAVPPAPSTPPAAATQAAESPAAAPPQPQPQTTTVPPSGDQP